MEAHINISSNDHLNKSSLMIQIGKKSKNT